MKRAGLSVSLWFALQIGLPGSACAQDGTPVKIESEVARQTDIYQSKGDEVPKGYVIGRGLAAYTDALPPEFARALTTMRAGDRWLDIGAGEGNAILDYYRAAAADAPQVGSKKVQTVAVSIEDRRTFDWHKTAAGLEINQIRYFYGKSLNDYTLDELGRYQIITDLLGGFSYTRDIAKFMEKTLGFLQVNGSFYSILQDVHSEEGSNKPHYANAPYLTEIVTSDGGKVKICEWLKSISCVQVTCELKPRWTPPVEVYRVQKTCDNVTIPALLPEHFAAGTPPERRFRITPAQQPRFLERAGATTPPITK